ncbi:MAG: YigZ family protein [Spirochaetales bacterium]|nr:YigZ family protein [Spirochaetales bacterium]
MKKIMIPAEKAEFELSIKKSRFISLLFPVDNDRDVRRILKELREEHTGANHVVWTYVLGDEGTLYGLSDDGEPHGTAGRPVLEVLKGSGLTYAALFVVRYFGGTKLGTGGLVSAYTQAAQEVLAVAEQIEKIDKSEISLRCSYSQYEGVKKILLEEKAEELIENFEEDVQIKAHIPTGNTKSCRNRIQDYTKGSVEMEIPDAADKE